MSSSQLTMSTSQLTMPSSQQDSIDSQASLEQFFENEEEFYENYLPEPPVEPEESTSVLIPATFGPDEMPLTIDNIFEHGTKLLKAHAEEHRLDFKDTTFRSFFNTVLHDNPSLKNLWSFTEICTNPMKVGNRYFQDAFHFFEETDTSSNSVPWNEGMRQLYVRCFTLSISNLKDIIATWEASKYFPKEVQEWERHCENESDEKIIYIRYVGQCLYPSRPWDRFTTDVASNDTTKTKNTFFTKFAEALAIEHPEVIKAAKVFALHEPLPKTVGAETVDDYERMLICLLGHNQLLNRQLGGFFQSFKPLEEHDELFKKLNTDIYRRWSQQSCSLPEKHDTITRLTEHVSGIQKFMHDSQAIVFEISEIYAQQLVEEQTPSLYKNVALLTVMADDVTLEAFTLQKDYFGRYSKMEPSRSSAVTINTILHLLNEERMGPTDIERELFLNMLPFKSFFPWVGKRFNIKARAFTEEYLRIVQPLLVIGLGSNCSKALASNLFHDNGFHSQKFSPFAGLPRLCSFAGDEWLESEEVDPPEESLFLLLPHIDPGIYKHYAESRPLHVFNHLCWIVTFLYMSLAMTLVDENVISPLRTRKEFLNTLMNQGDKMMQDSGLSSQLISAREEMDAMFKRTKEKLSPKPFVNEVTRERNSMAMMRSMADAGNAEGDPGSQEREAQLLRLWKMKLDRLHIIIPHDEDRKHAWLVLMNEVAKGNSYAASLMTKKQRQNAEAAGSHPLAHMIRAFKPQSAVEGDAWMLDEVLVQEALSARGAMMGRALVAKNPDFFSSKRQSERASGRDTVWHESIHNIPVHIRPDGKFKVHYNVPDGDERHIFTMHHKNAYTADRAERKLVVTESGLSIVNERGESIPTAKGKSSDFMSHMNLGNRANGLILKQAWERARHDLRIIVAGDTGPSRTTATVHAALDVVADIASIHSGHGAESRTTDDAGDTAGAANTASPSQSTGTTEESMAYDSDTNIFALALRLYNNDESLASSNLVASSRQNPKSTTYTLPVHISHPVIPFKRFLDDFFPNDGQILLLNPTWILLSEGYDQHIIWNQFLRHLNRKSRRHPFYEYWRGMAEGAGNLKFFSQHLQNLRTVVKEKPNLHVIDANDRKKRSRFTLLKFGSPLPGAGKNEYRL